MYPKCFIEPPPIMRFNKANSYILNILKEVCKAEMKSAADETVNVRREEEAEGISTCLSFGKQIITFTLIFNEYRYTFLQDQT
jgi:hypothetical protein